MRVTSVHLPKVDTAARDARIAADRRLTRAAIDVSDLVGVFVAGPIHNGNGDYANGHVASADSDNASSKFVLVTLDGGDVVQVPKMAIPGAQAQADAQIDS